MTVCGPAGSFGGVEARHCGDDVIRSLGFIDAQFRFNDFYCGRQWEGALAECLHAMEYSITGGSSWFVASVALSIRD